MALVQKGYYGWNYSEVDSSLSVTQVEMLLKNGSKYRGEFTGTDHAKKAIAFVNSMLVLIGAKEELVYCRMTTSFYQMVEEEKKEE